MTEKRFIMAEPMVTIKDLYFVRDKEQEVYLSISKGIDLLNIQSEYVTKCAKEKAQLIDALNQRTKQCDKLHEENTIYEKKIMELIGEKTRLKDTCNELTEHIERLKQRLKDKDELLRKELIIHENMLKRIRELENE